MADSQWCPFRPEPAELVQLALDAAPIAQIQEQLTHSHPELAVPDRVAHQYQIAGGKVELAVAGNLPAELDHLSLFVPGALHTGIGRLSTGLGVPHLETNPDFLGIMLAFATADGQRVDLLGINDPAAPADTHQDFISVLRATADAAGARMPLLGDWGEYDLGNLLVEQTELVLALKRHLGLIQGLKSLAHLLSQTSRTFRSSTAYQAYWSGILEAGDSAGKFTLVPTRQENESPGFRPGEHYLTEEWKNRLARGSIDFQLYWIPYLDERHTRTVGLTDAWAEEHKVIVGTISFGASEDADQASMWATLASEMGANPGNWISHRDESPVAPGTAFTAVRQLAYALSQEGRNALPPEDYAGVFASGEISPDLARELQRRRALKQEANHTSWAPED